MEQKKKKHKSYFPTTAVCSCHIHQPRLLKHAVASFCLFYYSWIRLNNMSDIKSGGGQTATHVRLQPERDVQESRWLRGQIVRLMLPINMQHDTMTHHTTTEGFLNSILSSLLKGKAKGVVILLVAPTWKPPPRGWVSRQQQQNKVDRFLIFFFLPSHAS